MIKTEVRVVAYEHAKDVNLTKPVEVRHTRRVQSHTRRGRSAVRRVHGSLDGVHRADQAARGVGHSEEGACSPSKHENARTRKIDQIRLQYAEEQKAKEEAERKKREEEEKKKAAEKKRQEEEEVCRISLRDPPKISVTGRRRSARRLTRRARARRPPSLSR